MCVCVINITSRINIYIDKLINFAVITYAIFINYNNSWRNL